MTTRSLLIFSIICVLASTGMTQDVHRSDSIEIKTAPLGPMKFYRNDARVLLADMASLMRKNPEAFKYINRSRTNNTVSQIMGFIGGFLIGFELGSTISGKEINWAVMGAGAGFIVVAIPFDIGAKRNARKAVYIYNSPYRE